MREREVRLPFFFQLLGWSPRDVVGSAVAILGVAAILINVLYLQSGSHPAPIFRPVDTTARTAASSDTRQPLTPPTRRSEPIPVPPPRVPVASPRMPGDIIMDIQRELSRRGFYEGTIDGLYGPRTDAAIRDFEHAAGLKPSAQPNEALLQAIVRSPLKPGKGITGALSSGAASSHTENVAEQPVASPRVIAVQRALAEFGYGQIKPSGIVDLDTQRAIERFERERRMPLTGQVSDRVIRELAATTGRPLE
jgi:peptidoglycan hydrolase-like protein with peptidoglycan-binding domain